MPLERKLFAGTAIRPFIVITPQRCSIYPESYAYRDN